jgi:hypothetical protein
MGGMDKLDFLITLYRTFIRSRKWTLKMFTHAVDMACANSWLEYKAKAALLNIPKRDVLDLLGFRAYVAEGLIKANIMQGKKQGRPLSHRIQRVRPQHQLHQIPEHVQKSDQFVKSVLTK